MSDEQKNPQVDPQVEGEPAETPADAEQAPVEGEATEGTEEVA